MRVKIIVYFYFLLQISLFGQNANTVLIFDQKVDLSAADALESKKEKGQYVFEKLKMHALATQGRARKILEDSNVEYRCFSIANAISCRAPESMIREFVQLEEVQAIIRDYTMKVPSDMSDIRINNTRNLEELPWGLSMIRADKVWEMGIRGQGVVVGGHDTGVAWQHPALVNNYRGADSQSIDHNYNWHDAIHSISPLHNDSIITDSTNPCGLDILEPCDDVASSHGTHTLGTVLGQDAVTGMTIGVAPQTKWIAVRNMERGYGSITSYLEGFEWFLAPTDLAGNNPDPAKAPDVINNSWACIEAEGCNPSNFRILETAVENLRKAGVFVVVSAGNSGSSGCESITTPAAIYDAAFTIGSTDQSDSISSFSSRGPVTVDGSFRLKPDVVAPGRGVLSSIRGDQYGNLSGTSMAGPHVAGVVALIISANPNLSGQVDLIEDIIRQTAVKKDDSGNCIYPDIEDSIGNFLYGAGRVDAFAAVMQALNHTTSTKKQNFSHNCRIFPNPAGEIIHIENLEPSPLNLRIFDLTGRKMISIKEFISQSYINSSHWPPGTYLVEIVDNFGNLDHRLIQVIK